MGRKLINAVFLHNSLACFTWGFQHHRWKEKHEKCNRVEHVPWRGQHPLMFLLTSGCVKVLDDGQKESHRKFKEKNLNKICLYWNNKMHSCNVVYLWSDFQKKNSWSAFDRNLRNSNTWKFANYLEDHLHGFIKYISIPSVQLLLVRWPICMLLKIQIISDTSQICLQISSASLGLLRFFKKAYFMLYNIIFIYSYSSMLGVCLVNFSCAKSALYFLEYCRDWKIYLWKLNLES